MTYRTEGAGAFELCVITQLDNDFIIANRKIIWKTSPLLISRLFL